MKKLIFNSLYKRALLLGAALFSFAFISCGKDDEAAVVDPAYLEGWTLTWQDEFDKPTVDPLKWDITIREQSHNNELQYYVADDVYIENGCLRLRSQKREYKGKHYTSGHVTSNGTFDQLYGRFEVRARLPKTKGIWPAHWMLARGVWPPEIDIMELLGHDPKTVYMTNHWGDATSEGHKWQGIGYTGPDFSQDFHVFAAEWSADEIVWYVDGVMRYRSVQGIPHLPMYVILNTAVGGDWPGYPDDTTVFPQYHDIDYVRVYTKNQ